MNIKINSGKITGELPENEVPEEVINNREKIKTLLDECTDAHFLMYLPKGENMVVCLGNQSKGNGEYPPFELMLVSVLMNNTELFNSVKWIVDKLSLRRPLK